MSAVIVPFPTTRRREFISRQANYASWMSPASAERYVQRQITIQSDAMRRKGIAEDLIRRELKCFETAVRSELLRASVSTGES